MLHKQIVNNNYNCHLGLIICGRQAGKALLELKTNYELTKYKQSSKRRTQNFRRRHPVRGCVKHQADIGK